MESITLTIANEREAIPVLQAAAAVYVGAAGADSDIARQTELVIEEIFTNIIQHEYRPGQREKISVALAMVDDVLELLIRFQGIPFDIDYLRQCEQASLPEMVASGGRGLGIHLLGEFSDEVQYRNLGWKGQEILIRRLIRRDGGAAAARREESRQEEEAPAAPLRIAVRRMRPEEAATISKLAYFAYRYTYIKEHLYDPEEVRRAGNHFCTCSYSSTPRPVSHIIL
ncbi:MAG TPA: ATP-binding protein, partial [Syntrophales bacterium]|nr:ATP-binding protein [Syntrophales bacterium]